MFRWDVGFSGRLQKKVSHFGQLRLQPAVPAPAQRSLTAEYRLSKPIRWPKEEGNVVLGASLKRGSEWLGFTEITSRW